ncbi:2Fe-2S iron-sulfur cluster binding domain-containing protein [bacterium]|nr:2Fe-2S iron-sulfur cluster binding domain-containing protein [bacterium]
MKVRFEPEGIELEVDPSQAPFGHDGKPFSILDIALGHGIEIEHQCGGNCACSTCHVIVKEGSENLSPSTEDEEDYLDRAEGLTPTSRLACQAVVKGDVVVLVPKYTRNIHFAPPPGAE